MAMAILMFHTRMHTQSDFILKKRNTFDWNVFMGSTMKTAPSNEINGSDRVQLGWIRIIDKQFFHISAVFCLTFIPCLCVNSTQFQTLSRYRYISLENK